MTNNGVFSAYVANLGKYNEGNLIGEWVSLPIDEDEFFDVLERIGVDVDKYEEYIFTEYSYDNCPDLEFKQDENYYKINEIAKKIAVLNKHETKKLEAIIEAWGTRIIEAWGARETTPPFDLENYHLYEDVKNNIDYKKYGRHHDSNCCGCFTSYGYIERA